MIGGTKHPQTSAHLKDTKTSRWVTFLGSLLLVLSTVPALPARAELVGEFVPHLTTTQKKYSNAVDFVVDETTDLAYVTRRSAAEIVVVSLSTGLDIERFPLGDNPVGIEISADGDYLYVALNNTGSVVQIDATTGVVIQTFDIADELNSLETWDVIRVDDRLFVSANTCCDAGIVEIDLTTGVPRAVANGLFTNNKARFAWDGGNYLYVGDANDLYQLDLTEPEVAVTATGGHEAPRLAASPESVLIRDGNYYDADTMTLVGVAEPNYFGTPTYDAGGDVFYMAHRRKGYDDLLVARLDASTLDLEGILVTGCSASSNILDIDVLTTGGLVALSHPGYLCLIDPFPDPLPTCDGVGATIIGTDGDDYLLGTSERDVIVGLDGDDLIEAIDKADVICGGPGDDTLIGGGSADTILGGEGADTLRGDKGADILRGGQGDDTLSGGYGNDDIRGASGIDTVDYSEEGPGLVLDLALGISQGPGIDTLASIENVIGTRWDDYIAGDSGPNLIVGAHGDNELYGRGSADVIIGGQDDVIYGGNGDDLIDAGYENDAVDGGSGSDIIYGGGGEDLILGGTGNDMIDGGDDRNFLYGQKGQDEIHGGDGPDYMFGGPDDDTLSSGDGDDHLEGGGGDDVLDAGRDDDELFGGPGADIMIGWKGDDYLEGQKGRDDLSGDADNDILVGGSGHDHIRGGRHNDLIAGLRGDDVIDGGDHTDIVTFELSKSGVDVSLPNGKAFGEGHDTLISVESIVGSDEPDVLVGKGGFTGIAGLGGADLIRGGNGGDNLFGNEGSDTIFGEDGKDWLEGNEGSDSLNGGPGSDVCLTGESHVSCENTSLPSPSRLNKLDLAENRPTYHRLPTSVLIYRLGYLRDTR